MCDKNEKDTINLPKDSQKRVNWILVLMDSHAKLVSNF